MYLEQYFCNIYVYFHSHSYERQELKADLQFHIYLWQVLTSVIVHLFGTGKITQSYKVTKNIVLIE